MIKIDGSYLEGGGQIIRTAIALSTITQNPVHIFNVRKGREKAGLRPQHLEGIKAAAKICRAKTEGLNLSSMEIVFIPGKISGGAFTVDTKTAGSITLILQSLVSIGIFVETPLNLSIKGGTAVPFSPTIAYFQHVLCFFLEKMGVNLFIDIKKHGFYPKGGGEILAKIKPSKLQSINLTQRGELQKIDVLSVASQHLRQAKVAERTIEGFRRVLPDIKAELQYVITDSPGCFISSHAHFDNGRLGADALGRKGKKAEDVGENAARNLKKETECDAPMDTWMVDQIIPFMALSVLETNTFSRVRIPRLTQHAKTNMWVVKKFLPVDFRVEENIMTCTKLH